MLFIFSKNNGFPQTFATLCLNAPFHQVLKHMIHRIGVKHKFIHFRRRDIIGHRPVILSEIILIPFLILF